VIESEVTAAVLRGFDRTRTMPGRGDRWRYGGRGVRDRRGGDVARLRLLHIEFLARRGGIGDALVVQCVRFARAKGYRSVVLWTPALLKGARRRYVRRGFERGETAMHERFGVPLRGESRQLELAG